MIMRICLLAWESCRVCPKAANGAAAGRHRAAAYKIGFARMGDLACMTGFIAAHRSTRKVVSDRWSPAAIDRWSPVAGPLWSDRNQAKWALEAERHRDHR